MKTTSSFPHPVLGVNKGVLPDLEDDNLTVTQTESDSDYIYTFVLKQGNSQIQFYLDQGYATYVCIIDCQKTLFKDTIRSNSPTIQVNLPKKKVSGHIDFNFYIITTKAMPNYKNLGFNKDYCDYETGFLPSFNLETGAVLAVFSSYSDNVTVNLDNKLSLSSFVQIIKGDQDTEHVEYDLTSDDLINIKLPPKQFESFHIHNKLEYQGIFNTSIISNALIYALLHLKDYWATTWADSIRARIESDKSFENLDLDDPKDAVDIAFKMLSHKKFGDPYDLLFECIDKINNQNIDD